MGKKKDYIIEFAIGAFITPQMKKAFEEAKNQVEKLSKIKNISNEVALGIGKIASVGAIASGTLNFGKDVIQGAIEYESKLADVKKVVDELGDAENLANFKNQVKDLTKVLPMSNADILDIATSAGQAGIAFEELTKFTEDAGKMGIAFDVSAEQAGEWMSKWRTSFKMGQDEVNELSDVINYLSNTSGANASQISGIVTKIGPLGDVAGVSAKQLAALGTSMVSVGVQEDVAATGIKNLMLNLSKGESATGRQVEAFKKLGLNAKQIAKDMQKDSEGTILNVFESLSKLNESDQTSVLQSIFGTESVGAIAPLLTNLEFLKEQYNKVGDASLYAGSMQGEFEARSDTTENKIQLAKNAIENLKLSLGDSLLPVLGKAAEAVSEIINSDQVQGIIANIGSHLQEFMPIVMEVVDAAKPVVSDLINVIVSGVKLVAPVVKSAINAIIPVIQRLMPPIKTVIGIASNVIQKVIPPLASAIENLMPVFNLIADFFQVKFSAIIRIRRTNY